MFTPSTYSDVPCTDLLSWAFGNPSYDLDKPIFIDAQYPEKSVSYNQAKTTVLKLIAGLRSNGLQPGDVVCLHSSNSINYALLFLAVIGAGGIFIGSNPHYTATELIHLFKVSNVKFVIGEEEYFEHVRIAARETGLLSKYMFLYNNLPSHTISEYLDWTALLNYGEQNWNSFADEEMAKTTVACLMSTSGTTGLPKAAQSTHFAQIAGCIALNETEKPYEIIRLICLPVFHGFNSALSLILPLRDGCKTYIMKRYNPSLLVDHIRSFQPTEITMVNPIIYTLMRLDETDKEALQCLRYIWCGGVPLDKSIQNQFREMLHQNVIVSQVYGMTEIGWAMGFKYPELDDTGSAGRLFPNIEARIIDADGNDIDVDNTPGEIVLRAPSLMLGYLMNENSTKNTIIDGWLHSGDIGYQLDGKWYIIDRIKELIKVRGWQVSPAEIEKCLLTHPAIIDVAVIGIDANDERGELPRAYVVVDPSTNITNNEIKDHLTGRLSKYKALDGGVCRMESLPHSATGKVAKGILRELALKEVLNCTRSMSTGEITDGSEPHLKDESVEPLLMPN